MRNHYIPQWLLRNFQDSSGKIYGFVKSNPARGIFSTTPKNIMVEKNLYSLHGESGPDRQSVEKWFSSHEARAKPVADKIIAAARCNELPRLTPEEKLICNVLHYLTWVRTPDIASEKKKELGPFDIDAFIEHYSKENNLNAHDMEVARNYLSDSDRQKVTDHNASITAIVSPPKPEICRILETRGLSIARISKLNKSFVIGSYALALVKHRGENHAWLPISHDVAVQPGRLWKDELVELTQDYIIRAINEASFRKSSIVVARSEQLLLSLASGLGFAL